MLVNKTVEFFLSEAAGRSGRSAGAGGGLGAARDRTGCRRGPRLGLGQNAGDQITWASSGLGAVRDRTRYRRGPRPGLGRDTGDQITGQAAGSERPGTGRDAGEKINSKEIAL